MTWTTRDKIFEVVKNKKLSTKEIVGGLEKIGCRDSYQVINSYLRKLTSCERLIKEKVGGKCFYYNPKIYGGKLN
jgi:hypothetical protein